MISALPLLKVPFNKYGVAQTEYIGTKLLEFEEKNQGTLTEWEISVQMTSLY